MIRPWVSVRKVLPPTFKHVNIYCPADDLEEVKVAFCIHDEGKYPAMWFMARGGRVIPWVSHWTHIPKLPKVG